MTDECKFLLHVMFVGAWEKRVLQKTNNGSRFGRRWKMLSSLSFFLQKNALVTFFLQTLFPLLTQNFIFHKFSPIIFSISKIIAHSLIIREMTRWTAMLEFK